MKCPVHYRAAWLGLLFALVVLNQVWAQRQRTCPQTDNPPENDNSRNIKITILRLELPGDLPQDLPLLGIAPDRLEKDILRQDITVPPEAPDSDWLANYVDSPIRDALQTGGFFKANVHSTPYLALANYDERQYVVAVEAETGPGYRLRKLQFEKVSVVKPDELRALFNLHPGDIFDVLKIRRGLEGVGKVYGRLGYIDATAEPETEGDEQQHLIDLTVRIDEDKQYRVGRFKVIGLDTKTTKSLESGIEVGQPFNTASLESLFEDERSILPVGSSPARNARISHDKKTGTVQIVLDFRPCPHG